MTFGNCSVRARIILLLGIVLLLASVQPARAQFTIYPALGLQTMYFNGDYPVSQPISPGASRDLPLGGGMTTVNNGLRLQVELIPNPEQILRFPLSFEMYSLLGKTTFTAAPSADGRRHRLRFQHSGTLLTAGAGITLSFFKFPSLYVSAEGKFNYLLRTSLNARFYTVETDSTELEREVHPDPNGQTRFGMYLKVGTQLDFFDPLLLDISIGYGALNLGGKDTDPATQRNLLVVDSRNYPEVTVGYIGVNFSLVWQL